MAETRLADIIVPDIMSDMVQAELPDYLDFSKLGIATPDYNNTDIKEGGHFANVPFYEQLSGDDEVLTDSTAMTPDKITTEKDIGVVTHRGKAWGSRDLAKIASGDDPMKEIARQVAHYWGQRSRNHLISVLNGVFDATAGALKDTHLHTVGDATGAAPVYIDQDVIIDGAMKMGDYMDKFDAILMHSVPYGALLKKKLINWPDRFGPDNVKLSDKGQFMGLDVVVSNDMPVDTSGTANLYTSYLMRKGCMYYGIQKELMTESDREILSLRDILATSIHTVPHLKLVKWNNTNTNPTNAELATPGNWTKVASDDRFIGAVAIVTN